MLSTRCNAAAASVFTVITLSSRNSAVSCLRLCCLLCTFSARRDYHLSNILALRYASPPAAVLLPHTPLRTAPARAVAIWFARLLLPASLKSTFSHHLLRMRNVCASRAAAAVFRRRRARARGAHI